MASYDSDSDDENATQLSYTETDVLLGYADAADATDADDTADETVSRLGGRPQWLGDGTAPSAALARCGVCRALLVLLLQLNGELPERFPGHERRLYVLACRNKGCRRQSGSVRVLRGVRVDAAAAVAEAQAAAQKKREREERDKAAAAQKAAPVVRGETLFGTTNPLGQTSGGNPFGGNPFGGNPFGGGGNPFSLGGKEPAKTKEEKEKTTDEKTKDTTATTTTTTTTTDDLPRTFAATLSLNTPRAGPPPAPEPWPAPDTWPAAYPVSWIADAAYETLDPTPAMPAQAVQMDIDDGAGASTGTGGTGKEDKYVFESAMDADFQRFADRVSQNPEQVLRYEFAGQPLLYSREDAVARVWQAPATGGGHVATAAAGPPRCGQCGARRVFEVQLMPHAIDLLEAGALDLEGMDWGTVVVAVCERDCQGAVAEGVASYAEEWVGVQWEELK